MPGAFPAGAIGDSPMPAKGSLPIVKTDSALIYRNEPHITIKLCVKKIKNRVCSTEFGKLAKCRTDNKPSS
jgi:hypothetical protein